MDLLINKWFVYGCVLLAFVLPVALWRRDASSATQRQGASWDALPSVFRMLWGPMDIFEMPIGVPLSRFFGSDREKYEKWILASSLPLTPAKVFALQALLLVGGVAAGFAMLSIPGLKPALGVAFMLLFGFVGWVYPPTELDRYVQWRQTEITRALPFAIDLIGSAMRSGLEFGAAMRYFEGLKMPGPLTEEFGKVLQQIELGKTRTEAISEMARRVQVEAFTSFAGVVAYGAEIGASISETLRVHGEELRRARFHLAERKAARAPSLMILPMAVFIMPAVFIIIITPVVLKMKASGLGGH